MSRYIDEDKANDFIKRSDAIDTMRRFNGYFDDDTITRFEIALTNHIQAADVRENVKGKWKIEYTGDGWSDYIDVTCTNCGKTIKHGEPYNFCPNCGADMRGEA